VLRLGSVINSMVAKGRGIDAGNTENDENACWPCLLWEPSSSFQVQELKPTAACTVFLRPPLFAGKSVLTLMISSTVSKMPDGRRASGSIWRLRATRRPPTLHAHPSTLLAVRCGSLAHLALACLVTCEHSVTVLSKALGARQKSGVWRECALIKHRGSRVLAFTHKREKQLTPFHQACTPLVVWWGSPTAPRVIASSTTRPQSNPQQSLLRGSTSRVAMRQRGPQQGGTRWPQDEGHSSTVR
jgi:hypothetical protein